MKTISLLQRQLAFSLIATVVFVIAGFGASFLYVQRQNSHDQMNPASSFANLVDTLAREVGMKRAMIALLKGHRVDGPIQFKIIDRDKKVAFESDPQDTPTLPADLVLPQKPMEPEILHIPGYNPPGPPTSIVRLENDPEYWLVTSPNSHHHPRNNPLKTLAPFVLVSALLSSLLSFSFLIYYLRKNSLQVEEVLSELHSGNLKARFKVKKLDEIGKAMVKFNEMADEIERLVLRVRETEKVRVNILQELGHDLRTPLASLSNMLETQLRFLKTIDEERRVELLATSIKEVGYLSRLVEDLLFLARVDDPRYIARGKNFDLNELVKQETDAFRLARAEAPQISIDLALDNSAPLNFFGDQHLLRRMLKNLLDNAFAFAKSRVSIALKSGANRVEIRIHDDGPGFPDEVLAEFGKKRMSRSPTEKEGRISLGLGSVITKAIVDVHQGELQISNHAPGATGAQIGISLPIRH